MTKYENFRCKSTENRKICHIKWRTENFQFSLTLRLRKTPLLPFVGCPKNDAIDPSNLVKSKNPWKNRQTVLNFLSSGSDCMFIAALVCSLWAIKLEEKILFFLHIFKTIQRRLRVNILDKISKNDEIWKLSIQIYRKW